MEILLFEGVNAAIIRAAFCTQHAACLGRLGDNKATVESSRCLGQVRSSRAADAART